MAANLNIALIQTDLVWENPEQNRIKLSLKMDRLDRPVDLIVLPEMFTSGFTMHPAMVAETMTGDTIAWLKTMAAKTQSAITGSMVIKEETHYYNRMVFVYPDGNIVHYDKRHTFTFAGEDKVYASGTKKIIIDYKGWKICPLVCYDLRFPVWSRNTENYEMLVYVASWPTSRMLAWDTLLRARAIENMSYCVGVNRTGTDGNNLEYSGHSAVYDMLGERIDRISENVEAVEIITLKKEDLIDARAKFNFLADQDRFSIK